MKLDADIGDHVATSIEVHDKSRVCTEMAMRNYHNLRLCAVPSDAEHRGGNSGVAPSRLTVKGAMEAPRKHSYLSWFVSRSFSLVAKQHRGRMLLFFG